MGKKKTIQGSLQLVAIVIAVIVTISMCTDKEETANNDWVTVPTLKVTNDMDLKTKAMYITLNTFKPDERLNPNGLPIIEKEMTLGSDVKINDMNDGTKRLSLKIRNNTLGGNLELTRTNTARILKNITPFMVENNIAGVQFEWTTPSELKNGTKIEPYYYVVRFETSTLEKVDLNTVDFNNLESYSSYIDIN